jgi:hypothetical protein
MALIAAPVAGGAVIVPVCLRRAQLGYVLASEFCGEVGGGTVGFAVCAGTEVSLVHAIQALVDGK